MFYVERRLLTYLGVWYTYASTIIFKNNGAFHFRSSLCNQSTREQWRQIGNWTTAAAAAAALAASLAMHLRHLRLLHH